MYAHRVNGCMGVCANNSLLFAYMIVSTFYCLEKFINPLSSMDHINSHKETK